VVLEDHSAGGQRPITNYPPRHQGRRWKEAALETNELPKTLDHVEVFSPPEPDSCRYRRSTGCTAGTNVLPRNMHVLLNKWMRGCRAGTLYKRRLLWWRRPERCTRGGRYGGGDQRAVPEEAALVEETSALYQRRPLWWRRPERCTRGSLLRLQACVSGGGEDRPLLWHRRFSTTGGRRREGLRRSCSRSSAEEDRGTQTHFRTMMDRAVLPGGCRRALLPKAVTDTPSDPEETPKKPSGRPALARRSTPALKRPSRSWRGCAAGRRGRLEAVHVGL
jgi:hypothetical protein